MKQGLLGIAMLLLVAGTVVQAQEYELVGLGTRVQGFADVTLQSQYVWRGFSWFGNKAAWQFTGGALLPDYGLGAMVSGHLGIGSGQIDRGGGATGSVIQRERWDYSLFYRNRVGAGTPTELSYRVGWVYYNHPKLPQIQNDLQEAHAVLALPNITGVKGLIPSYVFIKMWPAKSGGLINNAGYADGFMHVFNLDYVFSVPGALPEYPEQVVKFHLEATYNDGLNPVDGVPVNSGFSHAVAGLSTDFDLGYGFSWSPAVFYQFSMEDTVNRDNELWGTVGVRYQF